MSKKKITRKGKLIKDLNAFLDWRGCGDDPGSWARAYYKYTDCGPWVNFVIKDKPEGTRDVYYEDLRRGTSPPVTNDTCVGVEFGSIVEGSDANSGPFRHMFPFRTSEWERDEEFMEKETSYYWKRDNATWYTVRTAVEEWTVANVWGDIEWEGAPPPDDIKALAEKAIEEDWQPDPEHADCIVQTIPKMPGMWKDPQPDWKAMPLGDTEAEIFTFENDTTFD